MAKPKKLSILDEIAAGRYATPGGPSLDTSVAEGEGERRANAGIVGDLFNLLSRPARASATAALYGTDKDKNTSALQGIAEGLSGKSKTSYSDVVKQAGVKGPLAAVLGFAGDVAFDPLTYVGVRAEKGLNAAEAATTALRSGLDSDAVEREIARLQAENPGHAYATFFGKKVGPKISTEPARALKDVLIGDEGNRRNIAKAFSKKSELPYGLGEAASVFESGSSAGFHNHVRDIRTVFQDLTADERNRISHAIEQGESLDAVPVQLKQTKPGFNTLGDYQKLAKGIFDQYYNDEVKLGILKGKEYNPNYVYHYFQTPPKDLIPGAVEEYASKSYGGKPQFAMKRLKNVSLEDAKKLGYDPVEDIAQILEIRSAKHYRATADAAFVTDAVQKFGVNKTKANAALLKDKGWLPVDKYITHPVTDGMTEYLPKEIVKAMNSTRNILRKGDVASSFMKTYDKILREWKFLNTGASPGYHIRNTFTDALLNVADGVKNPKYYNQARRILQDAHVDSATALEDYVKYGSDLGRDLGGRKVNLGNHSFDTRELWELYGRHGGKSGFISTELENNLGGLAKSGVNKYYSNTKRFIGDVAQKREDFFRLAHFLDASEEGLKKGMSPFKAFESAASRVRKYNIDYTGLSSFERNTVNKVVPFYSFMRKNLPLQVELLFTKPGFMALYPKGQDLAQGLLGTETAEGDSLIPQWIRESAPVRVAMAKKEANSPINKFLQKVAGAKPDQGVFTSILGGLTPLGDIQQFTEPINRGIQGGPIAGIEEAARNAINMATPAIKAPIELGTQQNLYTGQDIKGAAGWGNWLANQLGPSRVASKTAQGDVRALTGWATGLPLQPVTEGRQAGEFKRREDVLSNQAKRSKLNALRRLPNYNALSPQVQQNLLARMATPDSIRIKQFLDQLRPKQA